VLARDDVDAVVIGSPDHWHVPMTVAAVEAGKDVYVEKPVTHSASEGPVLVEAVRRSKQMVQTGYQQRSYPHMVEAREMIRAGQIGPVTLVETFWNQEYLHRTAPPAIRAEEVDWDQFLGNAPPRPFDPWRYVQWRFYWDYGGGTVTDLFSHWIDVVHWILDDPVPAEAAGLGRRLYIKHWECPDTVSASLTYPKGHVVSYTSSMMTQLLDGGMVFRGTELSLHLTRNGYEIYSDASSIAQKTHTPKPDRTATAQRDGTIDHLLNWVECIRSRKTPKADVASAVAAANAAHYSNQALRSGKTLSLPPREGAWHRLFDGKTYKGWIPDSPDIWNIREAQIIGRAISLKWNEYLRTEGSFGDFELRLQFRLAGGNGQSGIVFRGFPSAEPHEVTGYVATIGEKIWGSLYDEGRRSAYLARPEPDMLMNLDPNGWHEYVIRAEGKHIVLTLNGVRTVDYEEPDSGILPRGFLAFQVHGGSASLVQFREIELRELY